MNQLINQPRPTVTEKQTIDPNSIMSYEDVLKDIDQTNAVVYEDFQQNQSSAQQSVNQHMQQQVQPQIQQQVSQQMQQQVPQQMQQQNQLQIEDQQLHIDDNAEKQRILQQQMMQQQMMQQQLMQQQMMASPKTPKTPKSSYIEFDKKLINDCVIIIIVYVLLNNDAIKSLLSKYIPNCQNGSAVFTLIHALLFVIFWILIKVGFSYISDKM